MRRSWHRLLGVAALLSATACGSDGSLSGPSAAPSGSLTLSGTVSENAVEGKRPSPRARVLVTFASGDRSVDTDEDGSFSISGLPAGVVRVSVTKAGYDETVQVLVLEGDLKLQVDLWRSEPRTERQRQPPAI